MLLGGAILWKGSQNMTNYDKNDKRLVYVELYHRHGDRTPSRLLYKNNPEKESNLWIPLLPKQYYCTQTMNKASNGTIKDHTFLNEWNYVNQKLRGTYLKDMNNIKEENKKTWDGHFTKKGVWIGALTQKGSLQLQDFGKWLRERYVNKLCYLAPIYKSSYQQSCKIYAKSTNFKRTIFSVDSLLYGLYDNNQRYDGDAIPIYMDYPTDHRLWTNINCKKYYKEFYNVTHKLSDINTMTQEIKEIDKKLKDLYPMIDSSGEIANALFCRFKKDIDLPMEINKKDIEKYCVHFFDSVYNIFFSRNDMLRLSNGVLLTQLLESMRNERGKFVINSGHDFTIAPLMWSLLRNCKDKSLLKLHHWPDYADNLIFEVWEFDINHNNDDDDDENKRFVRILHNRKLLKINGKEFIELDDLQNMWRDLLASEQTLMNIECCC